jgi:hypothetical protein
MFHIKFCLRYDYNCKEILKIKIAFYKHVLIIIMKLYTTKLPID